MNHDWNFEEPDEDEVCGECEDDCKCNEDDWEVYDD